MSRPFNDREHWSASRIQCYLSCPRKFYFRYVCGLASERTTDALVFGSALHRTVNEFYSCKLKGKNISLDEAGDLFTFQFEEGIKEAENIRYGKNNSVDSLLAKGTAMVRLYLEEMKTEQVIATEQAFTVPLVDADGNVLERPLVGFIDLITKDQGGKPCLVEIKTAARRFDNFRLRSDLQATAYCYATAKLYGERTAMFRFDVLLKLKTPALEKYYLVRGPDDYTRLVETVRSIERAIKAEVFHPAPSQMSCGTCDYPGTCQDVYNLKACAHQPDR